MTRAACPAVGGRGRRCELGKEQRVPGFQRSSHLRLSVGGIFSNRLPASRSRLRYPSITTKSEGQVLGRSFARGFFPYGGHPLFLFLLAWMVFATSVAAGSVSKIDLARVSPSSVLPTFRIRIGRGKCTRRQCHVLTCAFPGINAGVLGEIGNRWERLENRTEVLRHTMALSRSARTVRLRRSAPVVWRGNAPRGCNLRLFAASRRLRFRAPAMMLEDATATGKRQA